MKTDPYCADCGGWDIEWMHKCLAHSLEYCRGCECPECREEKQYGDEYDPTPWCHWCGAVSIEDCDCGSIADNHQENK